MELIRAGSLTFFTRATVLLGSILTNVILARALGPEGRGVYALVLLVPTIVFVIANLGVGAANVYFIGRRTFSVNHILGYAFSLSFALGLASTALSALIVVVAARAILPGIRPLYVAVACLALPAMLLVYFIQTIFQGLQRFLEYNLLAVVEAISQTTIVSFAVLILRADAYGSVIAWLVSWAPAAVAATALASRVAPFSFRVSMPAFRTLLKFGLVAYMTNLTAFLNFRFDVILVNIFAGIRQVGLYSAAFTLVEPIWYIATAASTVLAPRVAASDESVADRLTAAATRLVLAITLLASLTVALAAPLLVANLFGPSFRPSVVAIWLLLPGVVTFGVARVLSGYFLGRNKLLVDLLAVSIGLVLTLFLDLVLIPQFGFVGASIASSAAYTATMVVGVAWTIRHSGIHLPELFFVRWEDLALVRRSVSLKRRGSA